MILSWFTTCAGPSTRVDCRRNNSNWPELPVQQRVGNAGLVYWMDTFNIAYSPVDADVFLGTPTRLVDERGSVP